jgi:GNAT superfamily N-acetyltransferase
MEDPSHDRPAGLEARLLAAGFIPEDRETVLVGASATMAGDLVVPEGVLLRQVRKRADLERIAAMKSEVWGTDYGWVAADLQHRLAADPENLVVFMAEAAGTVVSAAWLEINPDTDFAGLWGGSTLPAWRGRGIYKALVAVRAQVAAERGAKYLQVDASTDSAPILRRLGFRAITTTTPFVWTPPGRSAGLSCRTTFGPASNGFLGPPLSRLRASKAAFLPAPPTASSPPRAHAPSSKPSVCT